MKIHFHIGGGPHRRRSGGIRHYGYDRPVSSGGEGISVWAALGIFAVIAAVFLGIFLFLK